eukprot:TRINITY_DN5507_c0_g1_i1.p4 TRINITY_DN5507_c0_g1~~TRINITY_DN5507_c0_g1_i1.p4  ORF type:complete len:128 (-),score=14.83 TRINITY_DN5507_c0_g1_i1:133-516(-)
MSKFWVAVRRVRDSVDGGPAASAAAAAAARRRRDERWGQWERCSWEARRLATSARSASFSRAREERASWSACKCWSAPPRSAGGAPGPASPCAGPGRRRRRAARRMGGVKGRSAAAAARARVRPSTP